MVAPECRGKEVDIHMFVINDHAGDKVSQRSRSGFLIYVNTTLVQWLSRKQSMIEASLFSIWFVATKQGIDALRGLRATIFDIVS